MTTQMLKIKYLLSSVIIAMFFVSCSDSVKLDTNEEGKYELTNTTLGVLKGQDGQYGLAETSFRDQGTYKVYLELNKPATNNIQGSISIDEKELADYNEDNGTSYILFPSDNYSFSSAVSITEGNKISEAIVINLENKKELDPTLTYAIPIKVSVDGAKVSFNNKDDVFLLLVKDFSAYPAPGNLADVKVISCMEINDCNPLNNLSFTFKNTGQPFIDMVILFSSNVNYDAEQNKTYIFHNSEMTNILQNREKYLKPLQDRGIKVMLSLLGNHDRAGIANLDSISAVQFAQEIKNTLDAYNLDGVMFDDEYSNYEYPIPPGFVSPSSTAAGNLMYETKRAIGDKLTFSYIYGRLNNYMPTINETTPADYVDYALSDYFAGAVSSNYYTGMTNKQKAPWSEEFARGYILYPANSAFYQRIVDDGYGAHLIFALDPSRWNFQSMQIPAMQKMAEVFSLDQDELVWDGIFYPTDYK